MKPTTIASTRCVYSTIELRSTPGTTSPLQNGQPWKPEPAGPQPRPESDTRTTPPTMMRTKVAMPVASTSRRIRGCAARPAARPSRPAAPPRPPRGGCPSSARRCARAGPRRSCSAAAASCVNHSSVLPCHGSLPARWPFLRLQSTLTTVTSTPIAEDERADRRDQVVGRPRRAPRRSRRCGAACPTRPAECWTRKVTLKPTNISQNESLPRASDIIRPVIFGNQ